MENLYAQVRRFVEPSSFGYYWGFQTHRTGKLQYHGKHHEQWLQGEDLSCQHQEEIYWVLRFIPVYTRSSGPGRYSSPRIAVPGIVRDCVARGVKAIVIITQGFADADEEGKRLDIHPMIAVPEGVMVLDARITLSG